MAGLFLLTKYYRCLPCKMKWRMKYVWGRSFREIFEPLPKAFEKGPENCPVCGKHRASYCGEEVEIPSGTVLVWDERVA